MTTVTHFPQKSRDFDFICDTVTKFPERSCEVHIKISFHEWNLVKFQTLTKLFASLCLLYFLTQNVDQEQSGTTHR